jgi:hypothetical protein
MAGIGGGAGNGACAGGLRITKGARKQSERQDCKQNGKSAADDRISESWLWLSRKRLLH